MSRHVFSQNILPVLFVLCLYPSNSPSFLFSSLHFSSLSVALALGLPLCAVLTKVDTVSKQQLASLLATLTRILSGGGGRKAVVVDTEEVSE
jgi:hypothetical protein